MKNFKCSVFHCDTPLKCGFVGSVSIYGNSYLSSQEIWKELHDGEIVDWLINRFSLEAWHFNSAQRKVKKFSMESPQIYYASHSDHLAMTIDGMNFQVIGNSVTIKFFDKSVMDSFLQILATMSSIKETSVSRS